MIKNFPSYSAAPKELLKLEGNCGPISVWGVLRYFRKRTAASRLIKLCRYTKRHGTFTIALAIALRAHGLSVTFYSDRDPIPNIIERQCFNKALRIGIEICEGVNLETILKQISNTTIPIFFFDTIEGQGHFSPVLGAKDGNIVLPYTEEGCIQKKQFYERWDRSEIYRQCIIATQ